MKTLRILIVLLASFNFHACDNDQATSSNFNDTQNLKFSTLTTSTILTREYEYSKDIIFNNNRDSSIFKQSYTYEEFLKIYNDSSWINNERLWGIIIDDDHTYLSIHSILQNSYDIVLGKVLKVEAKWSGDPNKSSINTYATIQVLDNFKDSISQNIIQLIDIGGQIGEMKTDMLNNPFPKFSKDEFVIVPISKHNNSFETHGRSQGKFSVTIVP